MGYFIKVQPDVKLFVEDLNPDSENTIVFLHGWPGSHELFEYQFNDLPRMGYRCIGIDQRGFGQSDKPATGYDYDRLSDDVLCIIETLQLKNIILLGHSTGGAIAIRYMARHKQYQVSKLVLCAAAAPSLIRRSYFPYGQKKSDIMGIIKQTYEDRPEMLREFEKQFFYQSVTDAFSDWFFRLGLKAAGWATAEIAATWLREEALFEDLRKIDAPTLIMHGIHDEVCYFPLAKAQQQGIRNSILIPFEKSGHGLFYEEKDKFNDVLTSFIESEICE
ncbi:MAG: alpha/beta hydrolase [bacterium]|nr:alpha/beta hydrolase [bacterium]